MDKLEPDQPPFTLEHQTYRLEGRKDLFQSGEHPSARAARAAKLHRGRG